MLLALGMFVFGMDSLVYNQIQRRRSWRHPTNDRVGARPAGQFAGPGEDVITLPGVLAPGLTGRREALDELAAMADAGEAYTLVDGDGEHFGAYVITDLDETRRHITIDSQPRLIDFTLTLKRMDDDVAAQDATEAPQ
ncbi:phage tail protein [Brevundimonas naejangsanensis]|uniref:phage tail protein n=1 Tax=Brevundimonas naejangsanensis TaxID=588932 RepID=UPI0039F6FBC6